MGKAKKRKHDIKRSVKIIVDIESMVIFQKHDHQVTYIEANLSVKTSLLWKTVPLSSILYFEISDLIGRNQSYVTVFFICKR